MKSATDVNYNFLFAFAPPLYRILEFKALRCQTSRWRRESRLCDAKQQNGVENRMQHRICMCTDAASNTNIHVPISLLSCWACVESLRIVEKSLHLCCIEVRET